MSKCIQMIDALVFSYHTHASFVSFPGDNRAVEENQSANYYKHLVMILAVALPGKLFG